MIDERLKQCAHDQPCVRRPQTQVRAEAEGDMRVGFSIEPDFVRCFKNGFVVVRRCPPKRDATICRYQDTMDIRCDRTDPPDLGQRHEDAKELFAG